MIGVFKFGVSLIGSFLDAGFLSKSLSVIGILKVISPESLESVTAEKPTAFPFQDTLTPSRSEGVKV